MDKKECSAADDEAVLKRMRELAEIQRFSAKSGYIGAGIRWFDGGVPSGGSDRRLDRALSRLKKRGLITCVNRCYWQLVHRSDA